MMLVVVGQLSFTWKQGVYVDSKWPYITAYESVKMMSLHRHVRSNQAPTSRIQILAPAPSIFQ